MTSQHEPKKAFAHADEAETQDVAMGSVETITDRSEIRPWTWRTFSRSVLLQMILFGLYVADWRVFLYLTDNNTRLSLVGPAMSDAITNLGGGGLKTPWLANLSTCLNYLMSFFVTIFGGPLINKIGIKWSCMIAALTMPLHGSSFYVNATKGTHWYLLVGNVSDSCHERQLPC
jgi:hypothetical protein